MRFEITPQIDRVIAKALAKWPEDRYQTAGKFSAAFAEAVANADNYVLSDSEAKQKAIVSSNGAKKALAPLKPTTQDKLTWKNSSKLRRIALPFFLLIAVIIGSVLSVFVVNKFINTNHARSTPTSSQTNNLLDNKNNEWPIVDGIYFFQNGQYHIKNISSVSIATAFYNSGGNRFTNFRLTVTASEVHGSFDSADYYGIIFRSSTDQNNYYLFEIETCCGGQYEFLHYNGQSKKKGGWDTLENGTLDGTLTPLSSNLSQTNVITVVANGNSFEFYVNNKRVGKQVIDHTGDASLSGEIGLGVEEHNTEVAFSHLYIDKL
jgi:eukaryotic-like serine/threonine-protein kinase